MAGSTFQVSKPMSVKEISARAQDFEFNPWIALKYWVRTADTLLREAQVYEQEENDQQAYLLFMRYATLVTEKLPLHPAAKDPESRQALKSVRQNLPLVLDTLEVLKPRITARYDAWEAAMGRRRESNIMLGHNRTRSNIAAASDPAVAGNTTTLAAADNSQLAVKLAHKETRRRDAAKRATRQAGVSAQEEQERRTAGLWDDWESALSKDRSTDEAKMQRDMEASRRRLERTYEAPERVQRNFSRPRPAAIMPPRSGSSQYRYPSITGSQPLSNGNRYEARSASPSVSSPPPKPPKESVTTSLDELEPPPRPEKSTLDLPQPDPATLLAKKNYTFRPSAYLESGEPLRTVFLPPTLRNEFLKVAEANTRRNLETCGMLCGNLISNALFIQKVVIPEQKSTSDTCETVNENSLFEYCANEDLLLLGWIHTHPTQSCFMSSVDLHTHFGYQTMMKESIAIVCAPSKNPSWGVFRLTDPPGKQAIAQCTKSSLFHPHDVRNLYTDALRPGHVFEADGLEFSMVDLRPGT